MIDWLAELDDLAQCLGGCVLVTVASARGSTPREAGAKMVVSDRACSGTIGGGQLEHQAMAFARELLAAERSTPTIRRFALGPSLGQCCGGDADVMFEPLATRDLPWLAALRELDAAGERAVLVTGIGEGGGKLVVDADGVVGALGDVRRQADVIAAAKAMLAAPAPSARLEGGTGDNPILLEPIGPVGLHVVLFGAGHVGRALVRVLGELPCWVTWVDGRAEQFPPEVPANVRTELTDAPEYLVDRARPDCAFLVMTHSHALDLKLCERILRRDDFAYFGLIGSGTKKARFIRRFKARGVPDEQIARMVCPIGIPGLPGKHPGEIAVAVAAQLVQVGHGATYGQRAVPVPA